MRIISAAGSGSYWYGAMALPGVRFVSVCSSAFAINVAVDVNACNYNQSRRSTSLIGSPPKYPQCSDDTPPCFALTAGSLYLESDDIRGSQNSLSE